MNDVHALQRSAPLATRISPEMRLPATVAANGETFRPWNLTGVWPVAAELSEHVVQHGRMFNEIDDEMARNVCVIGTMTRDEIWGSPEKAGKEIIPLGDTLYINGLPFTVIGMFQHYESEADRKRRELEKQQPDKPCEAVARDRGRGGRNRGGFVFALKNSTVYIPLNTMWMKFRSGMAVQPSFPWGPVVTAAPATGDPRLSTLEVKIASFDELPEALQQVVGSAWGTFCEGLGVSASDLDKMIGLPLLGPGGTLELIEETVCGIPVDEDYRQQCLDHMTGFWDRMIRDRHPA